VVVDEALEERERTDLEFGGRGAFRGFGDEVSGTDGQVAGLRLSDLKKIDMNKPVSADMDLLAEVLLHPDVTPPETFASSGTPDLSNLFVDEIVPAIRPITGALAARFARTGDYPTTQEALDAFLASEGHRLAEAKDPWGTAYRADFRLQQDFYYLDLISAGPDKKFGTNDDFRAAEMKWNYFAKTALAMKSAVSDYHERTGEFIRDQETLKTEMARLGVDIDSLRDPWGHAYRFSFDTQGTYLVLRATSAGPNGTFDGSAYSDDFDLARVPIDYFAEMRAKMDNAISKYFAQTKVFPESLEQLRTALAASGLDLDAIRDAWGHPYYATFRERAEYADNTNIEAYGEYLANRAPHTTITPVTRHMNWINLRSAGEDGTKGTEDDFTMATFSRVYAEQSASQASAVAVGAGPATFSGAKGAINGTVSDPTGAVIGGATVSAKNLSNQQTFSGVSGPDGTYLLPNLPSGSYDVRFGAKGFRSFTITGVPVRSSDETKVDIRLDVGEVAQEVTVAASVVQLQTAAAEVTVVKGASMTMTTQLSTPRLRQFFPETLLWRPEIVTDDRGRAQVKFPLADNITTWKLAAVASTVDGQMGTAAKAIRAFQPFFIEHDPPSVLTVGDEIALPVVLRNYLDRKADVNVEMKPTAWFALNGPSSFRTGIDRNGSASNLFRFTAVAAAKDGKQEVSAIGVGASDAISKTVAVHPNGEEVAESESTVFGDDGLLNVAIPEDAIGGSLSTTLKIYPNLNAHVMESIQAILERPYGCAEQTISAAYPGVLLLKYAKGTSAENSAEAARAQRYVQMAYERLLGYRTANGGFSYWGNGQPDLALTVYAIRFLSDASEFVNLDPDVAAPAMNWVTNQIEPDGHWAARNWDGTEDSRRSVLLTAYIARTIARSKIATAATDADRERAKVVSAAALRALTYLRAHVEESDEPYAIASFALTADELGDKTAAAASLARLKTLEHREGDVSYWALQANTPFYGWGLAGRVETTAIVLEALTKIDRGAAEAKAGDTQAMISRGLTFLMRNQDRYGVWYSTQATINVLDALAALTEPDRGAAGLNAPDAGAERATIFVDGTEAASIDLPAASALSGPVDVDLSKFVAAGSHRVEIRRTAGRAKASAQAVADYYVPWGSAAGDTALYHEQRASDAVRLGVHFDKTEAKAGDTIRCAVDAERIGFRGYGMLLAEIGLPPGVDVDRASLDDAVHASGWEFSHYDVLPDKVVVYLWPRAGGTKFSFSFKPRFGMEALSEPSVIYDYYNPEARAVVQPVKFVVKDAGDDAANASDRSNRLAPSGSAR
jgi:A-macroglobulin TED domain/Alpha-2-macroglobulin family/Carboxypeptidase regulatory-like domain/A-macroglobulin receptor binding domain